MDQRRHGGRSALLVGGAVLLAFAVLCGVLAPAGGDARATARASAVSVPRLAWSPCAGADGYQCASASVPRDYSRPRGARFRLAVAKLPATDPARRIGSLFVNFGGPGGPNVSTLTANGRRLFAELNERFDIVTFDPRGTGASVPAVDCGVDQEAAGPFAQPFLTPVHGDVRDLVRRGDAYVRRCAQRNAGVLPYVSTANVARDMDLLRRAVGDRRLSYLGLSYGTYLGATYAALFPHSYRALALEGALDADRYANDPIGETAALSAALERSLGRFLQACAADQDACSGFGGSDPGRALDALVTRLDREPLTVGARSLDGDDVRVALGQGLHGKEHWRSLAAALRAAEDGEGKPLRELADGFYARTGDGAYRPILDQFLAVSAVDQTNPGGLRPYVTAGERSWAAFDHTYFLSGYTGYVWGADHVRPHGVYRGPFRAAASAPTALVIGTTYDPATPYKDAVGLTRELGNARLLTMVGDGHGAYGGESACVDRAVNSYLERGVLPPSGTRCRQHVPF